MKSMTVLSEVSSLFTNGRQGAKDGSGGIETGEGFCRMHEDKKSDAWFTMGYFMGSMFFSGSLLESKS